MPTATAVERVYRDLTARSFEVRAESWDEKSRSFELTLSTEAPVAVMDMRRWEVIDEVLVSRGCKMPKSRQVPLLDSHNRYSVKDAQLGSARGIVLGDSQVTGRAHLASTEEDVAAKVREGHITDCSVGYAVINSVRIESGETAEVNGKSYTAGPQRALRVTTEWMLKEVSLCPIGADEDAKVREDAGQVSRLPARTKEGDMPETPVVPAGATAAQPVASVPAPIVRAEALKVEAPEFPEEALKRRVLAITPHDLVAVAERAILEGKNFDECRAVILAESCKGKTAPVGSTEPGRAPAAGEKPVVKVADVTGDVLVRSLLG